MLPFLLWLAFSQTAEKYGQAAPGVIPAEARAELGPSGFAWVGANKATEISWWPLAHWRAQAEPEQVANGLTLSELETNQSLGWLEVIKPFTDFRNREIPAGIYSLRLVSQPVSDDHNDTAPGPHFAMLVPAADPDWKKPLPLEEIFNRGKKILDKHPPVLLVHPGGKPLSKDSQDSVRVLPLESGWKALAWPQSIKTGSQGAKLEIRLVLEGHSPAVKAP